MCGRAMTERRERRVYPADVGDEIDVLVRDCAACGEEEELVISRVLDVHAVVAARIGSQTAPLTTEQQRFLRAHRAGQGH